MRFNINEKVRVRLTDKGRAHHRKHYEAVLGQMIRYSPYSPPREDADGWSEWMFWDLMFIFGGLLHMGAWGENLPFATEIELVPERKLAAVN